MEHDMDSSTNSFNKCSCSYDTDSKNQRPVTVDGDIEPRLCRCIECYNIIKICLGIDGRLVSLCPDGCSHVCLNSNIINESDKLVISRLVDELALQLIRTHRKQAQELMFKIPVYNPTPIFLVHLSGIRDDKIKRELASLDSSTRKQVLNDSIGLVFESINEQYYNLSVRKLLQWEIVA
jgi:hypothetical protein